jgi:hypothetical protein
MGFDRGTIAFTRFKVTGDSPGMPDEPTLERFSGLALRDGDLTSAEIEYGWCGGRHVLDEAFAFGHNVYAECFRVGLRIDTNKVPSEIKKAYVALEEAEAGTDATQRKAKRQAKENAARRIEEDLQSGKFRRSKMVEVLWDVPAGWVYAAVSASQAEQLCELFERTHGLVLEPITSGSLARRCFEARGKLREYEDLVPTRFFTPIDNIPADYPWTAKGDQAKDFLGNEFLMWLWNESLGEEVRLGDHAMSLMFARAMDVDCVYGSSGRAVLKQERPTAMSEAIEAARSGKVPRKAGLVIAIAGQLYSFTMAAETLSVSGLKLPEVENADTPRVLFEERITLLRDFNRWMDELFALFATVRGSSGWEAYVNNLRRRIGASKPGPVAAVA